MGTALPTAVGSAGWRDPRRSALLGIGALAGVALASMSAAIALGADPDRPLVALARAMMVATPIAVGLYAAQRRPTERFGWLLVGAGVAWSLTTLAESDGSLVYSIGRVAGWGTEILITVLVLSFPSGRLTTALDRRLLGASVALVGVLFLPTALLVAQYPLPAPYTSCASSCPDNAFQVVAEPPLIGDFVLPLRDVLLVVLVGLVATRLAQRLSRGTPPVRRMLAPVLSVGIVRLLLLAAVVLARAAGATTLAQIVSWMFALALPALALAFLVGLLRTRLRIAQTLEHLGSRLRDQRRPRDLRGAFAEAFGDPTIQIAFPAGAPGQGWIDATGDPVRMPVSGDGRHATEIEDRDGAVAAIVHDEALLQDQELVEAGGAIALMLLENVRLAARVEAATREVRRSRDRFVVNADRERRRIERDLHDGAQQRLVALRIELGLAGELVDGDPSAVEDRLPVLSHRLQHMAEEVDEAIDDIRSLAHGVYPALLADRGLADALRGAAQRSPVPTRIEAAGVGRYAPEIESALYFCTLEALQNVGKHAEGATRANVTLAAGNEELTVTVSDDGAGAELGTLDGQGMTNMRERLAAVGGELEAASAPGVGTVVTARVPARTGAV